MNRRILKPALLSFGLLFWAASATAIERVAVEDPESYRPVAEVNTSRAEVLVGESRYRLSPDVVIHRPDGRRGPLQVGEFVVILAQVQEDESDIPIILEIRAQPAP
jgi:hypothetical protein